MPDEDDDADFAAVIIEDDASKYKDQLTLEQRLALFHPNGITECEIGLTPEERAAIQASFSPDRSGFSEAMKGVLP
jgi:hypothetical protein